MRDDSANDTGEVSRREGDAELRRLAVGVLRLSEDVGIELLHDLLETEELGHRVRNLWEGVRDTGTGAVHLTARHLTGPQRDDGTEGEACFGTCAGHFRPGSAERNGESSSWASLDLDFGHLKWAERDIGEELGAGGAGEPNDTLVLFGRLLAGKIHVGILEDLVQAIFEHALERISDEGRRKAFPDTRCALLRDDSFQAANTTLVLGRVHLTERDKRE